MFSFQVTRNKKNAKRRIINDLQIGYLKFLIFFDFDPKIGNFDFSKINAYKIQNFQVIQKAGIYVIKVHTNNIHAKFQSNLFIFGCAMAIKQVKVMTSLFERSF